MTQGTLSARAFMNLLFHADKAVDVLETALHLGLLEKLDHGPVTLRTLTDELQLQSGRLYKFLECLESLGLILHDEEHADILDTTYRSREPLAEAAESTFGKDSIERQRNAHPWRLIYQQLPAVLRDELSLPADAFQWPHRSVEQAAAFEASMAATVAPIAQTILSYCPHVLAGKERQTRLLDVGGGDGTLGLCLLQGREHLQVDVYNLPVTRVLVEENAQRHGAVGRLGFVGGDFLAEPLPRGYDVMTFVRVLFDWNAEIVRQLLAKAFDVLPVGGKLIICEELRSPEQLGREFFWKYFLLGTDSNTYRLREKNAYLRMLTAVGFRVSEQHADSIACIVAERPNG